jgi:hypothetical protein
MQSLFFAVLCSIFCCFVLLPSNYLLHIPSLKAYFFFEQQFCEYFKYLSYLQRSITFYPSVINEGQITGLVR